MWQLTLHLQMHWRSGNRVKLKGTRKCSFLVNIQDLPNIIRSCQYTKKKMAGALKRLIDKKSLTKS